MLFGYQVADAVTTPFGSNPCLQLQTPNGEEAIAALEEGGRALFLRC